ncbi:unnamed protein product [Rotaria sordida]|uniref:Uncharacterized protein n=1 Tax=Rotaria sordida TaxID=392033 RepID=A0A813U308_9BILA|nr:unnamed protein product [Rotaria sordida]CAF0821997.1 unnamed protein product [Rotaria sordida]CAF3510580.1 unnamed protein product [Rotaria sordida]CAF3626376.1 unnamed protein product [Rotaria sordida]
MKIEQDPSVNDAAISIKTTLLARKSSNLILQALPMLMTAYERYLYKISTTITTIEPKKESLGISAALLLNLLVLVIAVSIGQEIRRGNVISKREGHS